MIANLSHVTSFLMFNLWFYISVSWSLIVPEPVRKFQLAANAELENCGENYEVHFGDDFVIDLFTFRICFTSNKEKNPLFIAVKSSLPLWIIARQ